MAKVDGGGYGRFYVKYGMGFQICERHNLNTDTLFRGDATLALSRDAEVH